MKNYGKELILDIHNTTIGRCTIHHLYAFCKELCKEIDMSAQQFNVWEYGNEEEYQEAEPHLKGMSAVQFIETSNITIHTLDDMKCVYLNIFSCKDFDPAIVKKIALDYFGGKIVNAVEVDRL